MQYTIYINTPNTNHITNICASKVHVKFIKHCANKNRLDKVQTKSNANQTNAKIKQKNKQTKEEEKRNEKKNGKRNKIRKN